MTDRLAALLHAEADAELVPVVEPDAILARARGVRRRRRLGSAALATGVASALVATVLLVRPAGESDAQQRYASATAEAAYRDYGAFAVGPTVYLGNHSVTFPDKVKSLYYTSVGVVVRHGDTAASDDAGPSRYELIRPDGTRSDLDLNLGDRVPGTSPNSPYFTYAEPANDTVGRSRWDLVAVDLRTGKQVAHQTIQGDFTWGGWVAPPVMTNGTTMWALLDDGWTAYDWAADTVRQVPGTSSHSFDAAGGTYVLREVVDRTTQQTWHVRSFTEAGHVDARLDLMQASGWVSPDGRTFRADRGTSSQFDNLETGTSVTIKQRDWGWTPDGDAIAVDPGSDEVTVCETGTGRCSTIHREIRDAAQTAVKLGGAPYES